MPLLDAITPVILTLDEAPNIGRALDALDWAHDIVVVDSGSRDATEAIVTAHPRARWFVHPFESQAAQWRRALEEVRTPWALLLDADMHPSTALVEELRRHDASPAFDGALVPFEYRIDGHPVPRALLRPQLRLVRPERALLGTRGHAHTCECAGPTARLRGALVHDDRKDRLRFLASQRGYARAEWAWLQAPDRPLRWADRVRKHGGPLGTLAIVAGTGAYLGVWRRDRATRRYWAERAIFEMLLAAERAAT